jgi:antitoxin (DNA-binding transcriptional repressor) of toxin-antitoxin stability system
MDVRIEFLCEPGLHGAIAHPAAAGRFLPDWFRVLPRDLGTTFAEGLPALSVKACLPVTDAFGLGFIVPLPFDVALEMDDDGVPLRMRWPPEATFQPITGHAPEQVGGPNPPFDRAAPLKWINPWRIKVPEGYSVLFTHPFNHFELPFRVFSGVVDCDHFQTTVNFPFVWTAGGGSFTLKKGMPIAQLVPIRRDALVSNLEVRARTDAEAEEQAAAEQQKYHSESAYTRRWRQKK